MHRRTILGSALAAPLILNRAARTAPVLRVGDQRGGYKSVMEASGVLDDASGRFVWSLFPAAAPLIEALNADAMDCGGVGDAPFAFARAAGARIKAIAATRSSGASTAIVVPGHSPFKTFADLKGHSIGTSKGSVGHFLILAAREKAGLKPSDLRIVFLNPADAKAAILSGAIDAWSTWSQYVYLAVAQDGARILLDGKGLMSGLSYGVASESAIAQKRDLLLDFYSRLAQALRWGLTHVDSYAEVWARETGVPVEVARQTLLARGFSPVPIDQSVMNDQQRTVDLYVKAGLLPRAADVKDAFDPTFNREG